MKAILILEMPSGCNKCPCFDCGDDRICCNALNKDFTNEDTRIIYKDCPLKPLPQKKDWKIGYVKDNNTCEIFNKNYVEGWNDCISEILGGEEE